MRKSTSLGACLLVLLLAGGCATAIGTKQLDFKSLRSDTVYVAPPRNLTHGGNQVPGSGEEFLGCFETKMRELAPAVKVLKDTTPEFDYEHTAQKEDVLAYAKSLGADYSIILELGEMRDAAPFTFRPDFVSLNTGTMYRVADGAEVWTAPLTRVEGPNLEKYNRLLMELAGRVVRGLVE
jgi:hypothetical protein